VFRPTIIVGLFLQQAIALFVLKSGAGFSIFRWIAILASDFLAQANAGATFFFDAEVVNVNRWFFVNVVSRLPSHILLTTNGPFNTPPAFRHNFFYCIRANDVLPWCHAMDPQALVSCIYWVAVDHSIIIEISAWLFYKLMNISGAEAVVAAASPFIGQGMQADSPNISTLTSITGESACLVRPYVDCAFSSPVL
jgi:CNT family concentrative nucleoside transporter